MTTAVKKNFTNRYKYIINLYVVKYGLLWWSMKNHKQTNTIIAIVIAIVIIIGIIISNKPQTESGEIVIGGAFALTGDIAGFGEMEKSGAEIAVEEINAKGGVLGKKLVLQIEDTNSTAKDTINAVSRLINLSKVSYIVGPTFLDSLPGAQGVLKGKDVMVVDTTASADVINTPNNPNLVSLWYRTDHMSKQLVEAMVKNNTKRIGIVQQNDPYYKEFSDNVKKYAQENNIEVVAEDLYNPGTIDFKTILVKHKSNSIDGIVFAMYDKPMLTAFLKQKYAIAPHITLYSNSDAQDYTVNPEYSEYLEGMILVIPYAAESEFMQKFNSKYNKVPYSNAVIAYDAVYVIAQMIEADPKDKVAYVKDATFETATYGDTRFDEIGRVVTKKQYSSAQIFTQGALQEIK
jgi:ABC-type branched-subunit amino acid transport system substrate-binding protein